MMTNMQHQCKDCAFTKEIVIEDVDEEDVVEYDKIQIAISSLQASNSPENLPKDAAPNVIKAYFEVLFEKETHYRQLERAWWMRILKKYKISESTKIDTNERVFYHCIDKKGKEMIDFKPKPKVNKK
jgi:hypothetical protein